LKAVLMTIAELLQGVPESFLIKDARDHDGALRPRPLLLQRPDVFLLRRESKALKSLILHTCLFFPVKSD